MWISNKRKIRTLCEKCHERHFPHYLEVYEFKEGQEMAPAGLCSCCGKLESVKKYVFPRPGERNAGSGQGLRRSDINGRKN